MRKLLLVLVMALGVAGVVVVIGRRQRRLCGQEEPISEAPTFATA
jgi:hypothetical protein